MRQRQLGIFPQQRHLQGIEVWSDIRRGTRQCENLAEGLGGLFKLGPGYDPEQEAMNNEMERRLERPNEKSAVFNPTKAEKMSKENEHPTEGFLGNIAEELATLSGTCEEIKETQLNCATTDDLNSLKGELETTMTEYTSVMKNTA